MVKQIKKTKFREIELKTGTKLLLGKNEDNNDELMKKFKGEPNTIIHTVAPGSPFCVIENNLKPSKEEIYLSGDHCAKYSQDWRDNKSDVEVNIFTGKDISKKFWMKAGTWKVKKSKKKTIKKADILKLK
jgi:predicted ribosome quality control (RQC) complex YloA/Tae2 family protein